MIFKKLKRKKARLSKYTKYSSYSRTHKGQTVEKVAKKRKRNNTKRHFINLKWFLVGVASIGMIIFGVYYIFLSGSFIVEETALFENNIRIDHDVILSEINVYKDEPILSINKFLLIEELKGKYPEIEHVIVKKRLPNRLHVYISKYPIIANLIVHVDNIQRKYLVNQRGMIAMADTEDSNLPYITVQRDKAYNSKEAVFEEGDIESIIKARKLFEQKFNMQVTEILYLDKARQYHLITEKNFHIWLDLTQNYVSQLSKLKAAEQKLNIHSTPLEYIDLRIAGNNGEKVIYKKR